jgi:transposase-like protein
MSAPSGDAGGGPEQVSAQGDNPERDEMVLALREEGRTYAGIARELGIERTLDANAAFNRALRRRPSEEQESLRNHEVARLDALAERLRRRSDLDEAEMTRRIRSLDRLKKTLLSA